MGDFFNKAFFKIKLYLRHFGLNFDRDFSRGLKRQIMWLLALMLVVYLLLLAFSKITGAYNSALNTTGYGAWYDILYLLIDPGAPNASLSATFSIICAVFGLAIFSGMLISVISNVLDRRVESYSKGLTIYNLKHHIVILGFNRSVPSLLTKIYDDIKHNSDKFILLMSDRDCEDVRNHIHVNVSHDVESRLVVLRGARNAYEDLEHRLQLHNGVDTIYLLGEENESAHDAINVECAKKINLILQKCRPNDSTKVKCHIQINSHIMFRLVQTIDVMNSPLSNNNSHLELLPFNFNEIWAQKALATIPSSVTINGDIQHWAYQPLDGKGITPQSNQRVHLVISGMNDMAIALATNAAQILHFPNFKEEDNNTRSRITFISNDAHQAGSEFRSFYHNLFDLARWREINNIADIDNSPWIDPIVDKDSESPYHEILGDKNFLDIEWEFISGNLTDSHISKYLRQKSSDKTILLTIALCEPDSEHNVKTCMSLHHEFILDSYNILVRQNESPVLINQLRKRHGFERVVPFGITSECYHGEVLHHDLGKLVHSCYCSNDKDPEKEWETQTPINKWSSIYSANMLFMKLRFIGLDTSKPLQSEEIINAVQNNADAMRLTEHNRWNTERLLLGFRPLRSVEERDKWKNCSKSKDEMKSEMLHLDILSNEMIRELDKETYEKDNDMKVNNQLHRLYSEAISLIKAIEN